jgi:hypothetical protein
MDNIKLVKPTLLDAAELADGKDIVVQFVVYNLPGK